MNGDDELIFLRDASLKDEVTALIEGIAAHPARLFVEPYHDPYEPEWQLLIYFYATSPAQLHEWVTEVRRRLADDLGLAPADAPTASELEDLELADASRN